MSADKLECKGKLPLEYADDDVALIDENWDWNEDDVEYENLDKESEIVAVAKILFDASLVSIEVSAKNTIWVSKFSV